MAWPWMRVLGALAVVAAVVLGDALRPGRTMYERDLQLVVVPHTEAFVRSVASGAWPVWNRALGFGEPLWAIPSAQVLYPPHWLNLIVQPWTYLAASAFLHLVLGGAGVYAFLRRGNAGPAAALCGGALWSASGPLLSVLTCWNHFSAFAWLPWVAVAADAAMERPSLPRMLAWGAAVAMTVLAGSVDAAAMARRDLRGGDGRASVAFRPSTAAARRLRPGSGGVLGRPQRRAVDAGRGAGAAFGAGGDVPKTSG
jgi:hypothetical protein